MHFKANGLARVGWALSDGSWDLGTDRNSWGYGGTAKKSNSKNFEDYGEKFGEKFDVIGCILDLDRGEISFLKNQVFMGPAFRLAQGLTNQAQFFPAICVKNAGVEVRFEPQQSNLLS